MATLTIEKIKTNLEPSAQLGYQVIFITKDGGVLCHACTKENLESIGEAIKEGHDPQWEVIAIDGNPENPELYCDHCSNQIPSDYAG